MQCDAISLECRKPSMTRELVNLEESEPTALAAGCSLVNFFINSGPKLAFTVHKVSAIG